MTYRYIDSEKIEKRRRSSTRTSGVIAIIIGLSFAACGIFFLVSLKSFVGMIVMLIFALIFASAGFYFFNQIKIEEKHSRELDDPNSKAYQKRQQYNIKKREKYLRKSEHHGSLKSILCHRAALIWGVSTIFVWLLSIVLLLAGIIIFILPVFDILLPIAFISSLFGKQYRSMLAEYAKCGIDKSEAENDFSRSRAYIISTDVIAISSRFIIASGENIVLPVQDIVWIYSGYDNIHKYSSGMYSHTERKYCVIIGLSNGQTAKIACPEELCTVIIDDVSKVGTLVTIGYSEELQKLFDTIPENFRGAVKGHMNIITVPVGPSALKNSERLP